MRATRNTRTLKKRGNLRRPVKAGPQSAVIEWFQAKNITRAEELTALSVPNDQCKVSDKMFEALFAPLLIGTQHQLGISLVPKRHVGRSEMLDQVSPIIYSSIQCQAKSCGLIQPRLALQY